MNCISKDKFINGIAFFIDTEILPKMSGDLLRWLAGGYMGTRVCIDLASLFDAHADKMRAFGFLTENGIDLDFLNTFMRCAFKKQEVLKLEPGMFLPEGVILQAILPKYINLTSADADRLLGILKVENDGGAQ